MMTHKSVVNLQNRKTAYSPYDEKRRNQKFFVVSEYQDVTVPGSIEAAMKGLSSRNNGMKERPNSTLDILKQARSS